VDEIRAVHRMIRERFKLSKAELGRQTDYIDEVTEQLLGKGARRAKQRGPAGEAKQSPPRSSKREMKRAPLSARRRHPGAPSQSTDSVDS